MLKGLKSQHCNSSCNSTIFFVPLRAVQQMPGGLEGAGALAVASPAGAQAQTDENEGEHGGGEEREQRQVLEVGAGDEVAELGGQRGQAVAERERVGGGRGGGRVAARVGGEQAVEARVLAVEEQGWVIAN